jgi:hypothetical protein
MGDGDESRLLILCPSFHTAAAAALLLPLSDKEGAAQAAAGAMATAVSKGKTDAVANSLANAVSTGGIAVADAMAEAIAKNVRGGNTLAAANVSVCRLLPT